MEPDRNSVIQIVTKSLSKVSQSVRLFLLNNLTVEDDAVLPYLEEPEAMENNRQIAFIASVEDQIVGWAYLLLDEQFSGGADFGVIVREKWRGQGVATRLVSLAKKYTKKRGYELNVCPYSPEATRLFVKCGLEGNFDCAWGRHAEREFGYIPPADPYGDELPMMESERMAHNLSLRDRKAKYPYGSIEKNAVL